MNVDTCRDKRKEEKMEGKERLNEADKGKKKIRLPKGLSGSLRKTRASTAGLRIFVLSINITIYLFKQGFIMQFWLP